MQQKSFPSPRRVAAIAVLAFPLSACSFVRPYGPPIPGSESATPSMEASGEVAGIVTGERLAIAPAPAASPRPVSSPRREVAVAATPAATPEPPVRDPLASPERFRSRADSVAWAAGWRRAKADKRRRIVVSLDSRTLWLLERDDTLRVAPVAIGTEERLVHGRNEWVFETPRGARTVQGKAPDPTWTPPLWHYVKEAKRHGVKVAVIPANGRTSLGNGERLEVRGGLVGRWSAGTGWRAWPVGDEIIIGDTLYVPPLGTKNRVQHGQLGAFKLDTGDGYLIHGSIDPSSIGTAATHGCLRLAADDLAFIYARVPIGTPVYIL